MTTINRIYTHKTHGEIGTAKLSAPDGKWTMDGNELSANAIEHLLTFSLQTLQDAYAGAKTADEAVNMFTAKLAKIIDGTIGVRVGGGITLRQSVARSIVRDLIKRKGGDTLQAYKDASTADRNAMLDVIIEKNETNGKFNAEVDAELERRQAAKAIDVDIEL